MNSNLFGMKECRVCGEQKPLSEFPLRKDAKDGRRNDCRVCNLSRQKEYGEKTRSARRQYKQALYKERRGAIVLQRREERRLHGDSINARRRELRQLNPDKYRTQKKEYLLKNPDKREAHAIRVKARQRLKRSLDAPTVEYIQLIRRDPCSYCGARPAGTWDHIEPVTAGGASDWTNATGACARCNSSKQAEGLLGFLLRP